MFFRTAFSFLLSSVNLRVFDKIVIWKRNIKMEDSKFTRYIILK